MVVVGVLVVVGDLVVVGGLVVVGDLAVLWIWSSIPVSSIRRLSVSIILVDSSVFTIMDVSFQTDSDIRDGYGVRRFTEWNYYIKGARSAPNV